MSTEALFDLDTPEPADRPNPKGMRELLFAGLLATLEAAAEDARPDFDHAEYLLNPDGTSRKGSPYWREVHHADGIRATLHHVRSALQTHEEYLIADRERSRATWTETEMACAQHRDVCPRCTEGGQDAWRAQREETRTKQLLDIYIGGIGGIVLAIAKASENGQEVTAASVDKELRRIQAAAMRARDRKEAPDV